MANLPNNLYDRGAVVFNTAPFTQFYLNSVARQRAKDEALGNYYNNFTKSINPAGMRTQDIEGGWMKKVNEWRDFYTNNADKIKKTRLDGGKAYNEFMSRYQDILNDTQKSKQAADGIAKTFPILSDPEKRSRLADQSLVMFHNADRSIYDPQHQPIDPASINYNPKDITANDLEGFNKYFTNGLKMSEGSPRIITDPKTKSKILTTESAFKPEDLGVIAERAEGLYKTSPPFKQFIDGMMNERDYNDLNNTFKQIYGHNIDMQHPEEMAAAYALKNNQQKVTNTSAAPYSPTTIKINNAASDYAPQSLDNYIAQLQANSQPMSYKYANGKTETHYQIQPSPELSNLFASKSGTQTLYPDQIQFLPNGDVLPIFYENVVKEGKNVAAIVDGHAAVDRTLTKPISQNEFRIRLAKEMFGEKGLTNVMKTTASQQTNLPKPKKSSNKIKVDY